MPWWTNGMSPRSQRGEEGSIPFQGTMNKTPWTDEEVKKLNERQKCGYLHPYTCARKSHDLVATKDGWYCPECEKEGFSYTQDWY